MQGPQAPKPFTRIISTALMAVVALYLVINTGVAYTCAESGVGSCAFLQPLPSFDFIPAIRGPVTYLIMCGYPDQAALALKIFSFTWFTGLIALATMMTLAAVLSLRTSKEERDQARRLLTIEAANAAAATSAVSGQIPAKDVARVGLTPLGLAGLILFLYMFWGDSLSAGDAYSGFTYQGFNSNLLFMIVSWSGLLFMSIFYIAIAIERFVLPPSHESQS